MESFERKTVAITGGANGVGRTNIVNSAHSRPERFSADQASKPKGYTSMRELAVRTDDIIQRRTPALP